MQNFKEKMEGEDCHHNKFGFCKFKEECRRKHFNEECKDLNKCKNTKTCRKRHPKYCIKYASGKCRFQNDCAYQQQYPIKICEEAQMAEKFKKILNLDKGNDPTNISYKTLFKCTSSCIIKVSDPSSKVKEKEKK